MTHSSVAAHILILDHFRKELNQLPGPQLHSARIRSAMRTFVEDYFKDVRPTVAGEAELDEVDQGMRGLLELCHKRPSVFKTKELLRQIKKGLIRLDTAAVISSSPSNGENTRDERDERILITLRALLPTAAMSYEQALLDLQAESRLSWRGPATDLREALRETLDHLAPDKDVKGVSGFKQAKDARGPTMKQKVR